MFEMTVEGGDELIERLRAAQVKLAENVQSGLDRMASTAHDAMYQQLSGDHWYLGKGAEGIHIQPNGPYERIVLPADDTFISLAVLDSGRPSGTRPNLDSLDAWVAARGLLSGKTRTLKSGDNFDTATLSIANAIMKRQTTGSGPGYHWFDEACNTAIPQMILDAQIIPLDLF